MPFLRDPFLVPPFLVPAIGQGAKEAGSGTLQPSYRSTDATLCGPKKFRSEADLGCGPCLGCQRFGDKCKTGCAPLSLSGVALLWCSAGGDRNDDQVRLRPRGSC